MTKEKMKTDKTPFEIWDETQKREIKLIEEGKLNAILLQNKFDDYICTTPFLLRKMYYYVDNFREINKKEYDKIREYDKRMDDLEKEQQELMKKIFEDKNKIHTTERRIKS